MRAGALQPRMHPLLLRKLIGLLLLPAAALMALADPAPPIAWQGSIDIAKGRGERGPWRQSESRYDYVDDPTVAIDERGEIAVAWVDQRRKAVLFQRFSPEGRPQLAQAVDVSRQPQTFSWLPRIALAPDAPQSVFVLWQEIIFSGGSHGGDILFARSGNGGKSFEPPINLSRSVGGDGKGRINRDVWHNGSLDLAAAGNGVLYAAWTEYDGALWFSRSTDGGRRFSAPARIATAGNLMVARAPALAIAPDGAVYLAWTVGEDDTADTHLAKSTDGGVSFGAQQRVARSPNHSDAPKLTVDAQGVLHLVYAESEGGPFDLYHVRYLRSADGARTFSESRDISSPLPPGFAGASFPSLSVDGKGRLYVVWELFAGPRQSPRGLALAVSDDGGGSFRPPALVPGSIDAAEGHNGSGQGLLMRKLAVNAAGEIAIVNSSFKQDSHSRVWVMRGAAVRR